MSKNHENPFSSVPDYDYPATPVVKKEDDIYSVADEKQNGFAAVKGKGKIGNNDYLEPTPVSDTGYLDMDLYEEIDDKKPEPKENEYLTPTPINPQSEIGETEFNPLYDKATQVKEGQQYEGLYESQKTYTGAKNDPLYGLATQETKEQKSQGEQKPQEEQEIKEEQKIAKNQEAQIQEPKAQAVDVDAVQENQEVQSQEQKVQEAQNKTQVQAKDKEAQNQESQSKKVAQNQDEKSESDANNALWQEHVRLIEKCKDKDIKDDLESISGIFIEFSQKESKNPEEEQENKLGFLKAASEIKNKEGEQSDIAKEAQNRLEELSAKKEEEKAKEEDSQQKEDDSQKKENKEEPKAKKGESRTFFSKEVAVAAGEIAKSTAVISAISALAVIFPPAAVALALGYAVFRMLRSGNDNKQGDNSLASNVKAVEKEVVKKMEKDGASKDKVEKFTEELQKEAIKKEAELNKGKEDNKENDSITKPEITSNNINNNDIVEGVNRELEGARKNLADAQSLIQQGAGQNNEAASQDLNEQQNIYDIASQEKQPEQQVQESVQQNADPIYDIASNDADDSKKQNPLQEAAEMIVPKQEAPKQGSWAKKFSSRKGGVGAGQGQQQ